MISYDQCKELLDDIVDELPLELYRELNGGIILQSYSKMHPCAIDNDLFILGCYIRDNLGKRIEIYYGSFIKVFPNKDLNQCREELKKILVHEVKHHNEFLAGVNDLVIYDIDKINDYLNKKGYKGEKQ